MVGETTDRRYRVGIDSTHPDLPARVILQPKWESDPIELEQYSHPDDAELAAVFFVDSYNAAVWRGFQLVQAEEQWVFRHITGAQVPVEEALHQRTPEEFIEVLDAIHPSKHGPNVH